MGKVKEHIEPEEAMKAVNTLLIFIIAEQMSFNLSKGDLYEKKIKMSVNALLKELEKYGDIYTQLCDISTEKFRDIVEAAETISLSFLNGFREEHIDIINKVLQVVTRKKYALQLAQVKAILANVKNDGIKEDRDKVTAERAINALLTYIIAQEMSSNLVNTSLYNKKITMHLNSLIKELEKDARTFELLVDFSKEKYNNIVKAVKAIAIPILNCLQAEHYPIISNAILVITDSKYALESAQLGAVLINVKDN